MICPFWLEFVCNEKRDSHGLNQFLTENLHMPTCPSSSNTTNYLSLINTANILLSHIAPRICKNETRIIDTGYDYWILINILLFYLTQIFLRYNGWIKIQISEMEWMWYYTRLDCIWSNTAIVGIVHSKCTIQTSQLKSRLQPTPSCYFCSYLGGTTSV